MERTEEHQKEMHFCFINYSKTFDSVDQEKMWNVLKDMGMPQHLIILMCNLYSGQKATIRTEYEETEWFPIGKGVCQDCTLSPYLFNLHTEHIVREAELNEDEGEIKIGGRKTNNLRYTNDTTLLADKPEDLKRLLKKLKEESTRAGLQLNLKKGKVMTTGSRHG